MHLVVRAAGTSQLHVDAGTRRRAIVVLAGSYARDAADLVELLAALGLSAEDGRPSSEACI